MKSFAMVSTEGPLEALTPESVKITFVHGDPKELPAAISKLEENGSRVIGVLDKETIESLAVGINQFEEEHRLK